MLLNCGVGEDSWESLGLPRTARRSNQSILKEISPECSLEGPMLTLKLQYFVHLMLPREELTHWKRRWCWERLRAGEERDDSGWDGWMASPTEWTLVWVDSRCCWWTGRPGMLWFMGSQRVGHNWATELNRTDYNSSLVETHQFLPDPEDEGFMSSGNSLGGKHFAVQVAEFITGTNPKLEEKISMIIR